MNTPSNIPHHTDPIKRKVLVIIHNPVVAGQKLRDIFGWNDPDQLARGTIRDIYESSFGVAQFEIVERIEVDGFPLKVDGFTYTAESFLSAWKSRSGFHVPDAVDYYVLLEEFDLIRQVDSGRIDEVWLFAFPYAGYYESIMGGPGAFWCNAPPLTETEYGHRRFVIMGFNYERGVGEMLENFGHRAESMLARLYSGIPEQENLWERFTRYDVAFPGQAEVGNVHFAPNSKRDYDWGNRRLVPSKCDDWYNFPDFTGEVRQVNCEDWGGGDIRKHHRWWFNHFPHVVGISNGISHNWWEYVLDPGRI